MYLRYSKVPESDLGIETPKPCRDRTISSLTTLEPELKVHDYFEAGFIRTQTKVIPYSFPVTLLRSTLPQTLNP